MNTELILAASLDSCVFQDNLFLLIINALNVSNEWNV